MRKDDYLKNVHDLKLSIEFCDVVYKGLKRFEIRDNDRDYKVGNYVTFKPYDLKNNRYVDHPISKRIYEITFIISGWGLENSTIAFGIKRKLSFRRIEHQYSKKSIEQLKKNINYLDYVAVCVASYTDIDNVKIMAKEIVDAIEELDYLRNKKSINQRISGWLKLKYQKCKGDSGG
ncbi:MAG: DUF3850 domain-containing protein [Anaerorhabdus sp.]